MLIVQSEVVNDGQRIEIQYLFGGKFQMMVDVLSYATCLT